MNIGFNFSDDRAKRRFYDKLIALGFTGVDFSGGKGLRVNLESRRIPSNAYNGYTMASPYPGLDALVTVEAVDGVKFKTTVAGETLSSTDGRTAKVGCQTITFEEVEKIRDGMLSLQTSA